MFALLMEPYAVIEVSNVGSVSAKPLLKNTALQQFFLRKMLGTRYGPDFSDTRDLMIIFSDSRDPIFNSNTLKKLCTTASATRQTEIWFY